jgi:hypothetical protein
MNESRQSTLVLGAVKTYLMSVHATQRRIEAPDDDWGASVKESYAKDDEGLYTYLADREQTALGGLTEFSDLAYSDFGFDGEERSFVDLIEGTAQTFTKQAGGDAWECTIQTNARVDVGQALYYFGIAVMIQGEPVRDDNYHGRDVVVFRSRNRQEAWVDTNTLFPIYYVFEGSEALQELTRTVEILALNPEERVVKPEAECVASD